MSCRSDQQFLTEQCDRPLRPDVSLLRASVGRYRGTAGGYLGVFGDETPVGPRRGPGRGPVAVAGIVVDSVEVVQKRNALVGRPAVPYDLSARVHCVVARLAL